MTSTAFPRRLFRALALSAAVIISAAGCSKDSDSISKNDPVVTSPATPDTVIIPEHRSFIAAVKPELSAIEVFSGPGIGALVADFDNDGTEEPVAVPNPLPSGAPTTFLIKAVDQVAPSGELFHEVFLPMRPNGVSGFIRAMDVTVSHTDMAAVIDLSDHTLVLTANGEELDSFTIAAGAPDTPTPVGTFYVKELVEPTNPDGAYGPIAFGLSGFSEVVLDTEAFQDGVIGIHGTNAPELLGTDVSHGCVRLSNEDVLRLEELKVPLGMPVTIQP